MKKGAIYLGVLFGFLVFYCSFAALFTGQNAYGADFTSITGTDLNSEKPQVVITKVDENGAAVKGAEMEVWRLPHPADFQDGKPIYEDVDVLLGEHRDHLKSDYTGKVDSWTTDETGRHVLDLSPYYPEFDKKPSSEFTWTEREQFNFYRDGGEPYYYVLIEKGNPEGYMSAEKTIFRLEPRWFNWWNEELGKYQLKCLWYVEVFNTDPRKQDSYLFDDETNDPYLDINYSKSGYTFERILTVKDIYAPLLIEKVDEDGDPVNGARLALYDAGGNLVEEWTSGNKAHKVTGIKRPTFPDADVNPMLGGVNVGPQVYTLKETQAPEGYEKAEDVQFKLYPCGKWDYMEGSEPSVVQHSLGDPTAKLKSSCDGPATVGSPCGSSTIEPDPATASIKYSYIDPVRIVNRQAEDEEVKTVTTDGFVINKIDQYREPIPDVEFEVYAKPELTYEAEVSVKKEWDYEGASTVTGTIGPDNHGMIPYEMYWPTEDDILVENAGETAFPYSFISDLKAEVKIIKGKDKQVFTGNTLSALLGESMTKGFREEGVRGAEIDGAHVDTGAYWHYKGEAMEDMGSFTIKEGETVKIKETMTGSLAGNDVSLLWNYYPRNNVEEQSVKTILTDRVSTGGFGSYNVFPREGYNNMPYAKAIDPVDLTFFPARSSAENPDPFGSVFKRAYENSNLVRHIAPGVITITFKDGKLIKTDADGNEEEIENNAVVIKNIVQWRGEYGGDQKCPPKWK